MATSSIDLSGDLEAQSTTETSSIMSSVFLVPEKVTVAREWINQRRAHLVSWRTFFKTDQFKAPSNPAAAVRRVMKNVENFQSNYLCVFIILVFYCILTSPLLLIALASCLGLIYFIRVKNADKNLVIAGRELSPALQYAGVAVLSFPLFYMAGAGSVVFWVIGASVFVIVVHALFYASEEDPAAGFALQMEDV